MTIGFHIIDGSGKKTLVKVSNNNEILVVNQFQSAEKITLVSDNVVVNILKPRPNNQIIITGLIVNTNRDVGVNGAIIEIYEASSASSSTIQKSILSFDLTKNETVVTSPVLIQTTEGVFINAKASDSEVNITVLSYFAPA